MSYRSHSIAICLSLIGLTACQPPTAPQAGSIPSNRTQANLIARRSVVDGMVMLNGPVANATVTFQSLDGKSLGPAEKTHTTGVFSATTDQLILPRDFRIVASLSATDDLPADELVLDVRDYDPAQSHFVISPMSTLLSAWSKAHPSQPVGQGKTQIASIFGAAADDAPWTIRQRFDGASFVADARKAGGIQPYVTALLKDMDTPNPPKRSYLKTMATLDAAGDSVVADLGTALGNAASANPGTAAIGWMMTAQGSSTMAAAQAAINAIDQKVDGLNQADGVLQGQVAASLFQTPYFSAYMNLLPLINANNTLRQDLDYLAGYNPADTGDIKAQQTDIVAQVDGTSRTYSLEGWRYVLIGGGSADANSSILPLWNKALVITNPLFGPAQSKQIQQHWAYLDAEQAITARILVEVANFKQQSGQAGTSARDLMTTWKTVRIAELNALRAGNVTNDVFPMGALGTVTTPVPLALADGAVVETANRRMWWLKARQWGLNGFNRWPDNIGPAQAATNRGNWRYPTFTDYQSLTNYTNAKSFIGRLTATGIATFPGNTSLIEQQLPYCTTSHNWWGQGTTSCTLEALVEGVGVVRVPTMATDNPPYTGMMYPLRDLDADEAYVYP